MSRLPRARKAPIVVACIVLVALGLVVGPQIWHWLVGDTSRSARTGVPDGAVESIVALRQDDGLFLLPEVGDQNTIDTKVHATYLASCILGSRFHEVTSAKTADALSSYALKAAGQQVLQLEAYAALKADDDARWKQGSAIAAQDLDSFPDPVTSDTLAAYLATAEPAYRLDPGVRLHALDAFDPGSDQDKQRAAASALALDYLFHNADAVTSMFHDLQAEMRGWDGSSTLTPVQLIISSVAMQSSGLYPESADELARRASSVHKLRGCSGSTYLISVDGSTGAACSLTLTTMAAAVAG